MRTIAHLKWIFSLLSLLVFACGNETQDNSKKPVAEKDSIPQEKVAESVPLKPKKRITKEDLTEELKPARENFKRINSIEKWTSTRKKDLEETTEGGEADYCYLDGTLEKIVMRQFGETFQKITEFYMLEGKPSFVFEKEYEYNRPIYWDSTAMKENGDNQIWDAEKSKITETRNYFKQGKLIHQEESEKENGEAKPSGKDLTQEQERISRQFKVLFPEPAPEK